MSPDYFRRRADDYRDAALCCAADGDLSGNLYSIAALFRAMADDLDRRRREGARPRRKSLFQPLMGKAA